MSLTSYDYSDVPTIAKYSLDDTLIRAVKGPMGSGKSVGAGVMEVYQRALRQAPGPDGVRRSRWAVVRNTTPQLIDTTIKTWMEWLPDGVFGSYKENPRPQYIMDKIETPDGIPIHAEIMFRALDKPDQLRDLLSLELTGCWFNEVREIAKAIFSFMRGRINRYPAEKDGGATWSGIFCDTNPCDTDHWFYEFFLFEKPTKCSTCKTSVRGMVLLPTRDLANNILPEDKRFCPQCGKDYSHSIPLTWLYEQPSALGPKAENLKNLNKDYYAVLTMGQSLDFIKVYAHGEWGFIGEGRPVYSNWVSQLHVAEKDIAVAKSLPLIVGIDFGLNGAAVICQKFPDGRFNVIDEVVSKDLIFQEFLDNHLSPYLKNKYMGMEIIITGDPSGINRTGDGNTYFKQLKAAKLPGVPAPTNTLPARLAAVNSFLTRPIPDQEPKIHFFQVSPKCKTLIRGFNGAYYRKRVPIIGKDMFKDEPEKTFESHIHDALQYAALTCESGAIRVRTHSGSSYAQQIAPPVGAYT